MNNKNGISHDFARERKTVFKDAIEARKREPGILIGQIAERRLKQTAIEADLQKKTGNLYKSEDLLKVIHETQKLYAELIKHDPKRVAESIIKNPPKIADAKPKFTVETPTIDEFRLTNSQFESPKAMTEANIEAYGEDPNKLFNSAIDSLKTYLRFSIRRDGLTNSQRAQWVDTVSKVLHQADLYSGRTDLRLKKPETDTYTNAFKHNFEESNRLRKNGETKVVMALQLLHEYEGYMVYDRTGEDYSDLIDRHYRETQLLKNPSTYYEPDRPDANLRNILNYEELERRMHITTNAARDILTQLPKLRMIPTKSTTTKDST
jgi:hypothetical protein